MIWEKHGFTISEGESNSEDESDEEYHRPLIFQPTSRSPHPGSSGDPDSQMSRSRSYSLNEDDSDRESSMGERHSLAALFNLV